MVIGFDIGTGSIRLAIHGPEHITKTFTARGYPFDNDGPVYVGEEYLYTRESVSLKYAFYLLANVADKSVAQYPMVEKLRQHDSEAFRQKLRTGILDWFKTVRRWIFQAPRNDWTIKSLPVTVPAQWGLEFERVILELLGEAFEWEETMARDKISFTKEADALANYILATPSLLRTVTDPAADQVWLVVDYGGHNLVGFPPLSWSM